MTAVNEIWIFHSSKVIEHTSGFRLELKAGSWEEPGALNPVIPENMPVREAALLIREGLVFACRKRKSRPSRKTIKIQTSIGGKMSFLKNK